MEKFPINEIYELKWWYKKWKIEKWFQSEVTKILKSKGFICFHPSDIWMANKFLDMHIISPEWQLHWIEFKKINLDTFNFSQFEDSQIILLRELDNRDMEIARVYIYSVKHNKYKSFTFTELNNLKNGKWWIKIF